MRSEPNTAKLPAQKPIIKIRVLELSAKNLRNWLASNPDFSLKNSFRKRGMKIKKATKPGSDIFKRLSPRTVMPPKPKIKVCIIRPARSAGKIACPKINPSKPVSIKCADVGPIGKRITLATKKAAASRAILGISSGATRFKP